MSIFATSALFTAGLIMIIKGSDWFIDAIIWIARISKIPDLIIGATLVSICTTLPETIVSGNAALRGNTAFSFGNALGSIACNIGFILAMTIILSRPELKDKKGFQKKGIFLIMLLVLIFVIGFIFGEISRFSGIILLGILAWYLFNNVRESFQNREPEIVCTNPADCSRKTIVKNITLFIIGLAMTITGSNLLVTNGEIIAVLVGVPDIVIGLTITALGTSLPELVTSITALRKNAQGISMGNILGASILNIILVIGLSAVILPISINLNTLRLHLPFTFLIVVLTVGFAFYNKSRFRRRNGLILLATYAVYVILTVNIF